MHDGNSDCTSSKFIQVFNSNSCLNRDGFLFAWGCVHRREREKNLPDEDVSTTGLVPL